MALLPHPPVRFQNSPISSIHPHHPHSSPSHSICTTRHSPLISAYAMGTDFAAIKHLRLCQNTYTVAFIHQNTYGMYSQRQSKATGPSPLPRPPSFESWANRKNFPVVQRLLQVEVQKKENPPALEGGVFHITPLIFSSPRQYRYLPRLVALGNAILKVYQKYSISYPCSLHLHMFGKDE